MNANVTNFNTNRGSVARAEGIVEELVGIAGSSSILFLQEVGAWRSGCVLGRFVFTAEDCPCAVIMPRAVIGIGAHFCSSTTAAVHVGDAAYLSAYLSDKSKSFSEFAKSVRQLELDMWAKNSSTSTI